MQAPSVEHCEAAESLAEQLFVQKAEKADTMTNDSPAEVSQQVVATASSTGYCPAPVASLIHNVPVNVMEDQMLEEKIGVPNGLVVYITGCGGESISSMQAQTGAKVQIQRKAEMAPGATQREI